MTQTTKLPEPPEFPASNASYNKIAAKMHKAAQLATSSTSAIAAVTAIRNHVTGVNTYAKKVRRYGEQLIDALEGTATEVSDRIDAHRKKVARAPKASAVEQAAADGDPVAGFMLKGAKAQKAVDAIVGATGFKGKAYSTKSNAKRALKAAQLDHLMVEWTPGEGDKPFRPVLLVDSAKGAEFVAERGFTAKVKS